MSDEYGKKLRIAMLAVHSSPLGRLGTLDTGGMSVCLLELASELGRKGNHVDIFTRQISQGGERVIEYAPHVRIVNLSVRGTEDLSREALFEHLRRFYAAIDGFSRERGCAYDLVHSNYWLSGVVGQWLKESWNCPHVITFHTLAARKKAALSGHAEDGKRMYEEARLLHCCDGVVVPTAEEGRFLASMTSNSDVPVHTIPWGVNLDHFTTCGPAAKLLEIGGLGGKPLLLFVGRFDPMKGIDLALQSFYRLKNDHSAHLILIGGDGPQSPSWQQMEKLSDRLAIRERVHFLGPIEHSQMVRYYQRAQALVVSSRYESFGLVILEALASGTPVAATPVGIAPSVIKPGVNGFLAAGGDDSSMALAISNVLALAERRDTEKIRQSVGDYSWSKVAAKLLNVYNKTLLHS